MTGLPGPAPARAGRAATAARQHHRGAELVVRLAADEHFGMVIAVASGLYNGTG